MDWDRDNAILCEEDLRNVFTFEPKPTTVVRLLTSDESPVVWSLEGKEDWDNWFLNELPRLDGTVAGLVTILARRSDEPSLPKAQKANSAQWLKCLDEGTSKFPFLVQKASVVSNAEGNRDLRRLPFSRDLFLDIASRFYMHQSIVKAVNRADMPLFSQNELHMDIGRESRYPAHVYNCRTTNSWPRDLALTATHFPDFNLTFAVLFGCPLSAEQQFIRRLNDAAAEAEHPLLMPGIFVEMERIRHLRIIEKSIGEIEFRILTLDSNAEELEAIPLRQRDKKNREKRSQWLDITYLRNMLVSWNMQLQKMESHAEDFSQYYLAQESPSQVQQAGSLKAFAKLNSKEGSEANGKCPKRLTLKIRNRLRDIINEYDDKIRDCTMRVDGMAMATQWAQGETSVDIALATSRDSRHMRSISLVTMVFLPGTFFASFFSMTFFNWFDDDGKPEVSGYLWIYVLVSAVFTFLTIGSWWCFGICRRRPRRVGTDEEKVFSKH